MSKINRGYVFKIYPTDEQKKTIHEVIGCCRFVYNYYLKRYPKDATARKCIDEFFILQFQNPWLKDEYKTAINRSLVNLERTVRECNYKGIKPKFKVKGKSKESFYLSNYNVNSRNSISLDLRKREIKLPILGLVKFRGYRNLKEFNAKILNATVSIHAGSYYVSLCAEEEISPIEFKPKNIVGIDLGIKDLVITSNGEVFDNKKIILKYEKKLKGLNKWLARTKKNSKNHQKVVLKIQKVYKKLQNARKYQIHSISKQITDDNDIIVTEHLKVNKMVQNKRLSKYIQDTSWYEFLRQLRYKSNWKNKKIYQISQYYPSSQICSRCGYRYYKVKDLSVRVWECPNCTNMNNRDLNASINIMFEGLKMYMKDEYSVS